MTTSSNAEHTPVQDGRAPRAAVQVWALLPLRLIVGFGFYAHGAAKWTRGPAGFAKLLLLIGTPYPGTMAWVVTLLEIGGGVAIMAGLLVPFAAVPLIASMVVAMLGVQLRYGFSSVNTVGLTSAGPLFGPPGYEINLLYIAALVALAVADPSPWSVDRWLLGRRRDARARARPGDRQLPRA